LPIADAVMGFAIEVSLDITMVASSVFLMIFCGLVAIHPKSRIVVPVSR
jgi:hypothetical protein